MFHHTPGPVNTRFPALDAVRGVAILLVILHNHGLRSQWTRRRARSR